MTVREFAETMTRDELVQRLHDEAAREEDRADELRQLARLVGMIEVAALPEPSVQIGDRVEWAGDPIYHPDYTQGVTEEESDNGWHVRFSDGGHSWWLKVYTRFVSRPTAQEWSDRLAAATARAEKAEQAFVEAHFVTEQHQNAYSEKARQLDLSEERAEQAEAEVARLTERMAGARDAALEEAALYLYRFGQVSSAQNIRRQKSEPTSVLLTEAEWQARVEDAEFRAVHAEAEQRGRAAGIEEAAQFMDRYQDATYEFVRDGIRALAGADAPDVLFDEDARLAKLVMDGEVFTNYDHNGFFAHFGGDPLYRGKTMREALRAAAGELYEAALPTIAEMRGILKEKPAPEPPAKGGGG
jgi:hypothetical protein